MESRVITFFFAFSFILVTAMCCGSLSGCHRDKVEPSSQKTLENQRVTIEGVAHNAVLGAVIVKENGMPVYVEGLSEWPQNVLGKKVLAKGLLTQKKLAPDPVVDKQGGVSHGMEGLAQVLEQVQWSVIEPW